MYGWFHWNLQYWTYTTKIWNFSSKHLFSNRNFTILLNLFSPSFLSSNLLFGQQNFLSLPFFWLWFFNRFFLSISLLFSTRFFAKPVHEMGLLKNVTDLISCDCLSIFLLFRFKKVANLKSGLAFVFLNLSHWSFSIPFFLWKNWVSRRLLDLIFQLISQPRRNLKTHLLRRHSHLKFWYLLLY